MKEKLYQIARDFFAAVAAGELPDAMLTDDMTGWITTGGTLDKKTYQGLIRLLDRMSAAPLKYTIKSLTADEDRVIAEAVSEGKLVNGEDYGNTYVFVIRVRDGKIAAVAEHYNALIVEEKLIPLMAQLRAEDNG